MTIQTVVFDMDGVLVTSEDYWFLSRQEFAKALGKEWTVDDQRHAMGRNTVEWAEVMQERLGINWSIDAIISDMKQRVINHYEEHLPLRPGAIESVYEMAEHYKVGLASGSPTEIIQEVMRLTQLDKVFEVTVYGDDFERGKPAPDIYLAALEKLRTDPQFAVGIEDSPSGIKSLKNAGMYAIAAPSPGFPLLPDIEALADVVVDSMTEVTHSLIEKLSR